MRSVYPSGASREEEEAPDSYASARARTHEADLSRLYIDSKFDTEHAGRTMADSTLLYWVSDGHACGACRWPQGAKQAPPDLGGQLSG